MIKTANLVHGFEKKHKCGGFEPVNESQEKIKQRKKPPVISSGSEYREYM
jgi:hypothetical protein